MLQRPVFYDSGARSAALCFFFFPFLFLSVRDGWRKRTILSDRASLEEQTVFIGPLVNIAPRKKKKEKKTPLFIYRNGQFGSFTLMCVACFFPPSGPERNRKTTESPRQSSHTRSRGLAASVS